MLKSLCLSLLAFSCNTLAAEPDAAQLLRNAAKLYRESNNFYLEWETKITTSNPYSSGWSRFSVITAASGKKNHFEQQGSGVNVLSITDGETLWSLDRGLRQYSIRPYNQSVQNGLSTKTAMYSLLHLDDEAAFAELVKEEPIKVVSATIPCSVVRTIQTTSFREGVDSTRESTYWIEKGTGLVWKAITVTHGPTSARDVMDDQTRTVETLYAKVQLAKEPDASLFVFTPPQNAYLTDDARQTTSRPPVVGALAPSLHLEDYRGKAIDLNDLKGKVVLVQFWATWCGGCLEEMKAMAQLPRPYFDKGLVIVGVDEDDFPQRGDKYLESQHYSWANLHDKGEVAKRAWGISSFPALTLIDRDGKVAWVNNTGFAKNFLESLKAQLDKQGLAQ